jgi:hypothetical protein
MQKIRRGVMPGDPLAGHGPMHSRPLERVGRPRGRCILDEIADRAGIGRTTVQNAMHEARRLGHVEITERPQRGAKNLPNLIKITSRDWLAWVKRGAQWDRVQKFKNVSTSKSWEKKEAGHEIAEGQ